MSIGQFVDRIFTINSGGNCMVDLVHLVDGRVLGVTDECAVLYPNEAALWGGAEPGTLPYLDLVQFSDPDAYEILKRIPDADRPGHFVVRFAREYQLDVLTLDDGKALGIDGDTVCLYRNASEIFDGNADAVIEVIDAKVTA